METPIGVMDEEHPNALEKVRNETSLFNSDPATAYKEAQRLVNVVSSNCTGPRYIAMINGKAYPKIEWWATVSSSLGLFPRVQYSRRLDREDEIAYEAKVVIHRNGQVVSSGEAMCSTKEARWGNADEYAIRSMAITRASGKSYRIPLSFLAVMAGLEATPAEEIPSESIQKNDSNTEPPATEKQIETLGGLLNDSGITYEEQTELRGSLLAGICKKEAGQLLNHFLGKSEYREGKWVKVETGLLKQRGNK
jgi:hypothetical protein